MADTTLPSGGADTLAPPQPVTTEQAEAKKPIILGRAADRRDVIATHRR